jgi:hypothetical protein
VFLQRTIPSSYNKYEFLTQLTHFITGDCPVWFHGLNRLHSILWGDPNMTP